MSLVAFVFFVDHFYFLFHVIELLMDFHYLFCQANYRNSLANVCVHTTIAEINWYELQSHGALVYTNQQHQMKLLIDKPGWLALFHLYYYIYSQIEIDFALFIGQKYKNMNANLKTRLVESKQL